MFFGVKFTLSRKHFAKSFREKLTKFRENQFTFRQSFVFAKGQKSVFVPTLLDTLSEEAIMFGDHFVLVEK
jgi:hypothetical protein